MARLGAPPDAKYRPTIRQQVQRGHFFSKPNRLVQRHQIHRGAYLDPIGYLGDGRRKQQWGGHDGESGVEVQFGQPNLVEAEFVRQLGLGHSVLVTEPGSLLDTAGQLVKNPKFHFNIPKPSSGTN